MNPLAFLERRVQAALETLQAEGFLPPDIALPRAAVEPPRDPAHGDLSTNAALVLAKPARRPPIAIAEALAERLRSVPEIEVASAAKPGFVNFRMAPSFWQRQVPAVLEAGDAYGRADMGQGIKVNVEFCSANPTGSLHVGHARGTVFGDALASLLDHAGYDVTREYYINDGGAQIEALARSIHHRYLEALGRAPGPMPGGLYPLKELVPVAEAIAARDGAVWAEAPEADWLRLFGDEAVAAMMDRIRDDLLAVGVRHDAFVSERALVEAGRIETTLALLEDKGLVYEGVLPPPKGKPVEDYEPVPQLLFRSTAYGDDSDRPLKRSNGAWTYVAADLAYHLDKIERGFDQLIDVLGADHGGYVKRMAAGVAALSDGRVGFDAKLCQLVSLLDAGQPLKMSKRAGRIVTMRDVVDEVGKDAFRFIMLTRKNDAGLDFDLQKVVEQSKDNPVFYVQYAHARVCSVFRNLEAEGAGELGTNLADAPVALLTDPAELALIRQTALFPRLVEAAAAAHEPHRVAFYLHDLAAAFHALWTRGKEEPALRFIRTDEPDLTRARLAMLAAVRRTIALGLGLMGVTPVSELT
ncbi:MAG: arginine--tRNA ligase [Geminicoccaceae bacterium]|nr:arginine--tRNA ligase [Geminicoccaceae bacterium]